MTGAKTKEPDKEMMGDHSHVPWMAALHEDTILCGFEHQKTKESAILLATVLQPFKRH